MRFPLPWAGATPPIGVDFNGRRCTAAQWTGEPGDAGSRVRTVRIQRPDPSALPTAEEFRRLAGVLERHGFLGGSLAIAAPSSSVMIETVELPPAVSGAPLDDLARAQLAMMYRVAPTTITASAIPLPARRDQGQPRSLAVGCRDAELAPVLAAAETAGLQVGHVTIGGLAAASTDPAAMAAAAIASSAAGASRGGASAGSHVRLLVLLGWQWSDLVVLRDGRLASARSLPELGLESVAEKFERQGGGDLMPDVEPGTSGPGADAVAERSELVLAYVSRLVAELRRSIGYVEQEHGPVGSGDMRVLGDGVAVPGLVDRLAEQMRMTVAAEAAPAVAGVAAVLAADARLPWRRNAA